MICVFLIAVILLQGGRGGLSDALGGAAAQSLFGSGAVTVLTRITTICAGLFVVTCLSLAYLSTLRGRSVIEQMAPFSLPGAGGLSLPITPEGAATPVTPVPTTPSETPAAAAPSDATAVQDPVATPAPAEPAPQAAPAEPDASAPAAPATDSPPQ
jgi:preprotein translocase subunit SecG